MDSLFVDSLEGFLLVTTTEGDIVFISESVNRYLGLQQVKYNKRTFTLDCMYL